MHTRNLQATTLTPPANKAATRIKLLYWTLTVLLCLMLTFDAIGGLTMAPEGQEALKHLGYPIYLLPFFGILKALAVIALLQNKFKTIKEWAYAGLIFNFIGAAWSNGAVDGTAGYFMLPLVVMAFTLLCYYLWKRYDRLTASLKNHPA